MRYWLSVIAVIIVGAIVATAFAPAPDMWTPALGREVTAFVVGYHALVGPI